MTTSVSPLSSRKDTPRSTSARSNALRRSTTSTIGAVTRSPEDQEKHLGEKEVGHDHGHGDVHDGGRGGSPEPFGAAGGRQPVVAPDEGHDSAEEERLADAGEKVAWHHP